MNGLSTYYARESRIRAAIRSAVTYPLVLAVMMALIVLAMVWKVLPVFQQVLGNMGVTLTDSGNAMMRVGTTIGLVIMLLVILLAVAVAVIMLLLRTKMHDKVLSLIFQLIPPIKRLQTELSSSRTASVLSMMLGGGFPLDEAL